MFKKPNKVTKVIEIECNFRFLYYCLVKIQKNRIKLIFKYYLESDLYRREVFHSNLNYAPKPFNHSEIFYLVRDLGLFNQSVKEAKQSYRGHRNRMQFHISFLLPRENPEK